MAERFVPDETVNKVWEWLSAKAINEGNRRIRATNQEIAQGTGLSTSTVVLATQKLDKRGQVVKNVIANRLGSYYEVRELYVPQDQKRYEFRTMDQIYRYLNKLEADLQACQDERDMLRRVLNIDRTKIVERKNVDGDVELIILRPAATVKKEG